MNPQIIEMMKTARKPYEKVETKEGEKVLIIADTRTEPVIWEVFAATARSMGAQPVVALMTASPRDYADPPTPIIKAAEDSDILHYVTSRGLVHSRFGRKMSQARKRRIISEGIVPRMLLEGAALANLEDIVANVKKITPLWDKGESVRITTAKGTDLTVGIRGHYSFATAGAELFKAPTAQFPGGEAPCTPEEDTGDGVLVIDKAIHYPEGPLAHPIRLTLNKGRIVDIDGEYEAEEFRGWLESWGDANGWILAELSVGTNPLAKFWGSMRQDRFVLGSFHVGFGMNADVGGKIESNIHYDAIMSSPTVTVDGQVIVEKGRITL